MMRRCRKGTALLDLGVERAEATTVFIVRGGRGGAGEASVDCGTTGTVVVILRPLGLAQVPCLLERGVPGGMDGGREGGRCQST